jgi:hypothetical protein
MMIDRTTSTKVSFIAFSLPSALGLPAGTDDEGQCALPLSERHLSFLTVFAL